MRARLSASLSFLASLSSVGALAVVTGSLCGLLGLLGGCSPVAVSGDFDGVGFFADQTALAVLDQHDIVDLDGVLVASERPEEQQTLSLLFTGAQLDVDADWRTLGAGALLDLKKALATEDGLLLEGIPLPVALEGGDVEARLDETGRNGDGLFSARLVVGLPDAGAVRDQGLGADVNLKVRFDDASVEAGGHVQGEVEIKRSRQPGQDGEVATGELTLRFTAELLPERLGKANLTVARPVMACAAALGPVRAGTCRDEPMEPLLDESTPLAGR